MAREARETSRIIGVSVIAKHFLVPEVKPLDEKTAEALLKKLGIGKENLPKIKASDPVFGEAEPEPGTVVKIVNANSVTGEKEEYYRVVVAG